MADNLRFVQFSHPGREHEPDPSGGKAWSTLDSQHARKFCSDFCEVVRDRR